MRKSRPLLILTVLFSLAAAFLPAARARGTRSARMPPGSRPRSTRGRRSSSPAKPRTGPGPPPISRGSPPSPRMRILRNGVPANDPASPEGAKYLETLKRPDGGIYREGTFHKNYETGDLADGLRSGQHEGAVQRTRQERGRLVRGPCSGGRTGRPRKTEPAFGGRPATAAASGPTSRTRRSSSKPLKASGAKSDDPAIQNALVFVSRCQNLESPNNTTPFAALVNDGGFYYTPAAGGTRRRGRTRMAACGRTPA